MYDVIQLIGWAGAIALLSAYGLVTSARLPATSLTYLALNLAGAIALGLSTTAAHAWPSAAVNVVWLAIGMGPLVRALRRRHPRSSEGLAEIGQQVGDILDTDREPHEVLANLQR
jgi:hypothetical protein